jgi:hypothetical protein
MIQPRRHLEPLLAWRVVIEAAIDMAQSMRDLAAVYRVDT